MRQYAEPSTRPAVDLGITVGPPTQGDFAAGLRSRVRSTAEYGTFATGMSRPLARAARTAGNFATGTRMHATALATGDFATGTRALDRGPTRPSDAQRSGSHRKHEHTRWAAA